MFQFPGFPSCNYGFIARYCNITCSEFPHSDICGSRLICSSPQLFAACHVLLRRHVPRHPPYALCSLIFLSRLLILTYLQNSLTSTRPNLFAILAFRLTLLSYVSVLTNLAFFFVFCLSYFASFSTMQLSISGILSKERGCRNRQPKYNIMFASICQAKNKNFCKKFFSLTIFFAYERAMRRKRPPHRPFIILTIQ